MKMLPSRSLTGKRLRRATAFDPPAPHDLRTDAHPGTAPVVFEGRRPAELDPSRLPRVHTDEVVDHDGGLWILQEVAVPDRLRQVDPAAHDGVATTDGETDSGHVWLPGFRGGRQPGKTLRPQKLQFPIREDRHLISSTVRYPAQPTTGEPPPPVIRAGGPAWISPTRSVPTISTYGAIRAEASARWMMRS